MIVVLRFIILPGADGMGWEVRDDDGLDSMVPDEYGAGNMFTMTQSYGSSIEIPRCSVCSIIR
jgi:hypothetical protein